MVVCGQNSYVSPKLKQCLNEFEKHFNCCVVKEYMANIEGENIINISVCFDTRYIDTNTFSKYLPDIVISFGGNIMAGVKELLRKFRGKFEHWRIDESGCIIDEFQSIKVNFECIPETFFRYFVNATIEGKNDREYFNTIRNLRNSVKYPEFEYSNIYAIKNVVEQIPSGSNLHMSINNSIRITNFFDLNPKVKFYANIGTHGIDGCLSSFLGQATVSTDKMNYLVIGDLSFFYDMNAIRIKHIKKNVRILLLNNHGGEEFYYNGAWQNENSDLHTTARHNTISEGWIKSVGFEYLKATNKKEYDINVEKFMHVDFEKPVVFEVFTEMKYDADKIFEFYKLSKPINIKEEILVKWKSGIKSIIGTQNAKKVKSMFKI